MERSKQVEIENDYKNAVHVLEEDLQMIGEYEAQIKRSWLFIGVTMLWNFLFSTIFYLLALASFILAFFYFSEILVFLQKDMLRDGIELNQQELDSLNEAMRAIKYGLIGFSLVCFLIASLIFTIRRKNRTIRALTHIVAIIKKNTADRLEAARMKQKHAHEFMAENQRRL